MEENYSHYNRGETHLYFPQLLLFRCLWSHQLNASSTDPRIQQTKKFEKCEWHSVTSKSSASLLMQMLLSFLRAMLYLELHTTSGLVFLVTLIAQPWPTLTWWKFCLWWPSSKQRGLWWCPHVFDVHTKGGWAVARSHPMISWSLWILLGFLFASTHTFCSLVLFYTF